MRGKYRFFYHWRKQTDAWTVHFRGKCIPVDSIKCLVPCETKKNKRQPVRVMQGFACNVEVDNGIATIT